MDRKGTIKLYAQLFSAAYAKLPPTNDLDTFVDALMHKLQYYHTRLSEHSPLFLLLLVMFEYFEMLDVIREPSFPVSPLVL
jgi:hypothetical protein